MCCCLLLYTGPGHGKRAPGGGGGWEWARREEMRTQAGRGWRLLSWVRRPFQFSPGRDREPSAVSSSPTAAERESKAGTPSPVHHSTLPTHGRIYSSPNTRGRRGCLVCGYVVAPASQHLCRSIQCRSPSLRRALTRRRRHEPHARHGSASPTRGKASEHVWGDDTITARTCARARVGVGGRPSQPVPGWRWSRSLGKKTNPGTGSRQHMCVSPVSGVRSPF